MGERLLTVTYRDVELRLTHAEYDALREAAYDDPTEALRLADEFAARQASDQ